MLKVINLNFVWFTILCSGISIARADRVSLMKYVWVMERAEYTGDMTKLDTLLVDPQVDINGKSPNLFQPKTALIWAIEKNYTKVFFELLKSPELNPNYSPSREDPDGRWVTYGTPFYYAAQAPSLEMAKALVEHPKFKINTASSISGAVPIMELVGRYSFQAWNNRDTTETIDLMKVMLARSDLDPNPPHGCSGSQDKDPQNFYCDSLLWNFIKYGIREIFPNLLARDNGELNQLYILLAALKKQDDPYFANAIFVHKNFKKDELYALEEAGRWNDAKKCTPAGLAILYDRPELALELIHDPDLDIYKGCVGRGIHWGEGTLLAMALKLGAKGEPLLDALLDHPKFDLLHQSKPLAFITWNGRSRLLERVLNSEGIDWHSKEARPHLSTALGNAIYYAQEKEDTSALELILTRSQFLINAKLSCSSDVGGGPLYCKTPLTLAAGFYKKSPFAVLKLLLQVKGVDINAKDDHGNAVIHALVRAASRCYDHDREEKQKEFKAALKLILKTKGVNVNARGGSGHTALYLAKSNKLKIFAKMIKHAGGKSRAGWEPW